VSANASYRCDVRGAKEDERHTFGSASIQSKSYVSSSSSMIRSGERAISHQASVDVTIEKTKEAISLLPHTATVDAWPATLTALLPIRFNPSLDPAADL